jgi:hypothetical protein
MTQVLVNHMSRFPPRHGIAIREDIERTAHVCPARERRVELAHRQQIVEDTVQGCVSGLADRAQLGLMRGYALRVHGRNAGPARQKVSGDHVANAADAAGHQHATSCACRQRAISFVQ